MRLFVAVPVVGRFDAVAGGLARLPGARPVPEASHHVTLRFLGEVLDRPALEAALDGALRGRPALPFVAEGLGAFPNPKQARIVWAGVRAPGIEALAAAVEAATARFGEPPERRRFVAHVTLARLARPRDLRSLLDAHRDASFGAGLLDQVGLYDSAPGPKEPRYEPVRTWRLGEA